MSIRARILALVGCFAAMAFVITVLGLVTISDYNRMMGEYDRAHVNAWRGERLNHLVSNVVMETRGIYIARSAPELEGFVDSLNHNLDDMESLLAQWKAEQSPKDSAWLTPLGADAAGFIALRRQLARPASEGKTDAAYALSTNNRSVRIAFQARVESVVQQTLSDLATAKAASTAYTAQRARDFLLACALGVAVMILLSLWMIARFISTPLNALANAIIGTSNGDYSLPLNTEGGKDDVANVWRALGILKQRAIEADRLAAIERETEKQREQKLRELVLD